jgi:hypothetical protein
MRFHREQVAIGVTDDFVVNKPNFEFLVAVTPKLVLEILKSRDDFVRECAKQEIDVKYGELGKICILPGRKDALKNKKELVDGGMTPIAADRILRVKLLEKYTNGKRNSKVNEPISNKEEN